MEFLLFMHKMGLFKENQTTKVGLFIPKPLKIHLLGIKIEK